MTNRTQICIALIFVWVGSFTQIASAQNYRKQDAGLGGLAGAVIGGIIGHQNDETAEGALIGGAVGAIAGSLLGEEKDRQSQHYRYYQQEARRATQHQPWQRQQSRAARAVSINDVVNMTNSGIGDAVILNQIQARGVLDDVGTHEIIAMHKRGVSESVITAMQTSKQPHTTHYDATSIARVPPRAVPARETVIVERTPVPVASRPVIVREEVRVLPPRVYVPHPRVRYATRPAIPAYPSRVGFRAYW